MTGIYLFFTFVHLFTHTEGETSDSNTQLKKMHYTKCLLQGLKPHVVNHGILTKLSSFNPFVF